MSVFDEINTLTAEQVLSVLNLPLANDGKSYVCPMCGNGEHGNPKDGHGDGIRPRKNQKGQVKWHCFGACAKDYSNFDLAAASLGLDAERDTAESARRDAEWYRSGLGDRQCRNHLLGPDPVLRAYLRQERP